MTKIRIEVEVDKKYCEGKINCPFLHWENETCYFSITTGEGELLKIENGRFIRCQTCKDAEVKG